MVQQAPVAARARAAQVGCAAASAAARSAAGSATRAAAVTSEAAEGGGGGGCGGGTGGGESGTGGDGAGNGGSAVGCLTAAVRTVAGTGWVTRGRLHTGERTVASWWRGHGAVSGASADASGDSSGSEGSGAGSDKRGDGADGCGGCRGRGGVDAGSSGRIRPKGVAAQRQGEGTEVVRETGRAGYGLVMEARASLAGAAAQAAAV